MDSTRRRTLTTLTAIFFIGVAVQPPLNAAASAKKPNIVLILSDDQAWGDYGFMGHTTLKTPHLDKLARESLTYTRGYVPSSLCCPSLASIITGQYPHQHRVTSNDPPVPQGASGRELQEAFKAGRDRMNAFMDAAPTLPKLLVQNGYLALQTGKWWQGSYQHGGFTHGMTEGSRHGDKGLDIGRKTMEPIFEFIQKARTEEKPFFVWYAPMLPHGPHNPPERLLAKYREKTDSIHIARYWAMVEWFDETCGELIDHIDSQGLGENTIIAYVTDNGWIQNPNGPKYAEKSKQSPYDGGLRTPVMLRWKAKVAPSKDADHLASSLDLAPTLLTACGIPVPSQMAGMDLFNQQLVSKRSSIHGECFTHNAVDLDSPEKSLRWRWVIDGDWKLIIPDPINQPNDSVEVYNLRDDPSETKNLAAVHPERCEHLRGLITARWAPNR